METIVFSVSPRSPVVGLCITELRLPEGVHINLIKRNGSCLVPHGNMCMMIKDKVTVIVLPQQEQALREWLRNMKLKNF